ncbi:MAG: endosialidase [Lachnospiraceae bacterium]|nr:endosialidase [Lachnospiraceae bacterium]
MSIVKDLLHSESDGSLSFGNHELPAKEKVEDFRFNGKSLKVKTFKDITKLESDGELVYESVPGTSVNNLVVTDNGMRFRVEGANDAQITVGLKPDTEYEVLVSGSDAGRMKTNLGGKLSVSVELEGCGTVDVEVREA